MTNEELVALEEIGADCRYKEEFEDLTLEVRRAWRQISQLQAACSREVYRRRGADAFMNKLAKAVADGRIVCPPDLMKLLLQWKTGVEQNDEVPSGGDYGFASRISGQRSKPDETKL